METLGRQLYIIILDVPQGSTHRGLCHDLQDALRCLRAAAQLPHHARLGTSLGEGWEWYIGGCEGSMVTVDSWLLLAHGYCWLMVTDGPWFLMVYGYWLMVNRVWMVINYCCLMVTVGRFLMVNSCWWLLNVNRRYWWWKVAGELLLMVNSYWWSIVADGYIMVSDDELLVMSIV